MMLVELRSRDGVLKTRFHSGYTSVAKRDDYLVKNRRFDYVAPAIMLMWKSGQVRYIHRFHTTLGRDMMYDHIVFQQSKGHIAFTLPSELFFVGPMDDQEAFARMHMYSFAPNLFAKYVNSALLKGGRYDITELSVAQYLSKECIEDIKSRTLKSFFDYDIKNRNRAALVCALTMDYPLVLQQQGVSALQFYNYMLCVE